MKRFTVVIPKDDGGVELHPMKEWLRQHPEYVPASLDATASTSHQLRNGLKKMGWTIEEYESETRLIMPSDPVLREAAHVLLGNPDEASDEPEEQSFELEHQLRDFLAQNLPTVPIDGHRLKLYVDPTGRDGIEYPTAVGPIDILATAGGRVCRIRAEARSQPRSGSRSARAVHGLGQTHNWSG